MTTITDGNLNVSLFNTIRTAIVSYEPKVTESTNKYKKASIKAAYDDSKVTTPQVILTPLNITESDYKFGSQEGRKVINVIIECYYTNTLGIDQLSDDVTAAIKGINFGVLDLIGMSSDYAFVNPNEAKFHLKTLVFTFLKE
jgi:hypothetical protein